MLVIDDIDSWITFPTTSSPHGSGRLKSRSTSRENMNYKNPISHTRHLSSLHSNYSLPTTLLEFHHGSRFSLDQWCQLLPGSSQRSGLHPPIFTFESIALAKSTYSAKIARPTFAKKMTASMGYATHINNIYIFFFIRWYTNNYIFQSYTVWYGRPRRHYLSCSLPGWRWSVQMPETRLLQYVRPVLM